MISLLNMNSSDINNNNNEGNGAIIESFDYINIIETLFDSFNMNLKLFNFIYAADNNITNLAIKNIKAEKQDKIFNISILKCDITLNILTPVKITSTISKANKDNIETILNMKESTNISINLVTGIIDAKIINPVFDINMQIIQALNESYKFLIDQINLDVILCKLIIEINNTKVNFNQFNYIIENINFKNFTEVTNDTMFVKIKNIIMRHKDIDIIKEKGIDIEYKFVSSTENLITFKSNDLNINITQSDIYYLVLSLKTKKENDINKDKDKDSTLILDNNTTSTNFIENNFTPDFLNQINNNFKSDNNNNNFFDLNGDFFNMTNSNNSKDTNNNTNNKDNNELIDFTLNTQNKNNDNNKDDNLINNTLVFNNFFNDNNSPFNLINTNSGNSSSKTNKKINNKEKKKIFELKVKAFIPCVNLSLNINENSDNSTNNNYIKISEFSVTSSSFEINSLTTSESGNETVSPLTEVDYKIYLGQLLLKYFDNDKNEIIMLNFEKGDKNNKKYKNQIEISYSKNEMSININKNEVIVRADSFLALYYYFKGSLPIDGIMDNLYQVEKINNATHIQINFNDSKFQLQTSFDGEENLHLDISSFVILYNSLEDGLFPYGNLFITLNAMSTTLISKNHSRKLFYTKNDFLYIKLDNTKLKADLEVRVGILIINLSYSDVISFLRAYFLNKTFLIMKKDYQMINL